MSQNYESFDISKTHSLSSQNLVKIFIDLFIIMTMGEVFLNKNQTKIYSTSSVLHQILWNKIVKLTRSNGHWYRKVKTGTWYLNKWPKLKNAHLSTCCDKLIFVLRCWLSTTMCHTPLLSFLWVESKYEKIGRLGMVPGTW